MLKRNDPAFDGLVAVIKWVVSSRYVEDPDPFCSSFYMMTSGEEPSFAFASLNRRDRLDLLAEMVPWRNYCRSRFQSGPLSWFKMTQSWLPVDAMCLSNVGIKFRQILRLTFLLITFPLRLIFHHLL